MILMSFRNVYLRMTITYYGFPKVKRIHGTMQLKKWESICVSSGFALV